MTGVFAMSNLYGDWQHNHQNEYMTVNLNY